MLLLWPSLIFYVMHVIDNLFFYKLSKFRNAFLKVWIFVTVFVLFHLSASLIILVACIISSYAVFCDV